MKRLLTIKINNQQCDEKQIKPNKHGIICFQNTNRMSKYINKKI
jgi:hypothetical protein